MGFRNARHAAAVMLVVLAACGGSSGTREDPIAITFSPTPFASSFTQGAFVPSVTLNVTLSRLPDVTVYVVLIQDQPVLASTTVTATRVGTTNTFTAQLTPSCELTPGSHTGNMTLLLCSDPACNGTLSLTGNVLPYVFTVTLGHILTAKVGGVNVPGLISQCTPSFFSAKVGSLVEIVSSVPVNWATSIATSAGVPVVSGVTTTSTTWSGTVAEQNGNNMPGVTYGVVFVHATPVSSGPTVDASITVVGG